MGVLCKYFEGVSDIKPFQKYYLCNDSISSYIKIFGLLLFTN